MLLIGNLASPMVPGIRNPQLQVRQWFRVRAIRNRRFYTWEELVLDENVDLKQMQNLKFGYRKQGALNNLQRLGVVEHNGDQGINVIEQKLHLVPTSECILSHDRENDQTITQTVTQIMTQT